MHSSIDYVPSLVSLAYQLYYVWLSELLTVLADNVKHRKQVDFISCNLLNTKPKSILNWHMEDLDTYTWYTKLHQGGSLWSSQGMKLILNTS